MNINLYCSVNENGWETALPQYETVSESVVSATITFIEKHEPLDFFDRQKSLAFNLCLSNDDEVHALNKEFRKIDKPTNVLSFANIDDPTFEESIKTDAEIEMGDIIIALQTLYTEAEQKKISLHDHFCHLLVHGTLHLLGYDHIQDDEAEHMESLEIKILETLNINNPYQE